MMYFAKLLTAVFAGAAFGIWQHSPDAAVFMMLLLVFTSMATEETK